MNDYVYSHKGWTEKGPKKMYQGIDNKGSLVQGQYYHDGKRAYIIKKLYQII